MEKEGYVIWKGLAVEITFSLKIMKYSKSQLSVEISNGNWVLLS